MPILPANGKIHLAVVTGGHTFQVPPFYEVFRHWPNVDFWPQSLDEFTADADLASQYDVVLFYTMHQFQLGDKLPWYQAKTFSTLEQLGRANQGILVLHHALVAFPDWPLWSELVGIANRQQITPHFAQQVPVEIADAAHPITQGLENWTLPDETYEMASAREENGNYPILTTSHPHSMNPLAWTRQFRESRVFCLQLGHDAQTFEDKNFRRVLYNAVHWLAENSND
jgi:type 1 glutamine amidotransferase